MVRPSTSTVRDVRRFRAVEQRTIAKLPIKSTYMTKQNAGHIKSALSAFVVTCAPQLAALLVDGLGTLPSLRWIVKAVKIFRILFDI